MDNEHVIELIKAISELFYSGWGNDGKNTFGNHCASDCPFCRAFHFVEVCKGKV